MMCLAIHQVATGLTPSCQQTHHCSLHMHMDMQTHRRMPRWGHRPLEMLPHVNASQPLLTSIIQGYQQQPPPGSFPGPSGMAGPAPNGMPSMQQQPPAQHQQAPPPAQAQQQQAPPAQPKPDWTEHKAPDGRLYWYNAKTKVSKWDKPAELLSPEVRGYKSQGSETC